MHSSAHKMKMERKAKARADWYAKNGGKRLPAYRDDNWSVRNFPASVNRHTGKPHEHRREIARLLGLPR